MNNEKLSYNSGVFSPDFIPIYPTTLKDGLSLPEGYVYGFIHFYTCNEKNKGRKFYFTNNQLSEILNFSSQQISRIINQLVKKNYIRSTIKIFKNRGKVRFIVALKK
jgi:DNA-binding MarR family transcriptional regulator